MKKLMLIAALVIVALPILAFAQEKGEADKDAPPAERVQKAAELIRASREAREAGIPAKEVAEALESARERGLSPGEIGEVMAESTAAVHESGPVDNFGSFVETKLDEGLRGKELAAAIHEEHRLHGKGKGQGQGQGEGKGQGESQTKHQAQHKMKNEEHKGQQQHQESRHLEGDNDDGDAEGKEHENQDKGGKKGKGK